MARQYDIAKKLSERNQKPTVSIDEEHVYKINNTAPAAMMIEALQKDSEEGEFEMLEKIITISLGQEAAEYIKAQEFTMPAYTTIVNVIMAALADTSLEEVEEMTQESRFQEKGKAKRK